MTAKKAPGTLVVGRIGAGPAAAVLDVVRDWTTTDLLAPSLWLDVDQTGGNAVVHVVDRDGMRTNPAQSWLALNSLAGLRIVLLQVFDEEHAEPVTRPALDLLNRIGLGALPLVNLLVPAEEGTNVPQEAALTSRPNVLLQPRDGQGPGVVSRPVPGEELAEHAAGGLATVGALWRAMDEAPFDGTAIWPGQQVVVARSYARVLDSGTILTGLSDAVYRAEGSLPRPRTASGDRLTDVPDAQALPTVETAAIGVIDAHADITRFRPPPPFQPAPRKAIGLLAAIKMFLSFLWAAIRNAPRAWVEGVVRRAAVGVASSATAALFGDDSEYEIVVLGVRSDGSPAAEEHEDDVSALVESAQRLAHTVSPGTEFTAVDTSALWADMTTVGVSLADGSEGPAHVHLPMLGVDRQVIDRAELIVPSPGGEAHGLPVGVLPGLSRLTVRPDDPYLAVQAYRLLNEKIAQPDPSSDDPGRFQVVDTARNALVAWIGRQGSYTWRVGLELAEELDKARKTLAEAVESEKAGPSSAAPREVLETQQRTRRFVLGSLATLVVVIGIIVGLLVGGVLSWLIAAIVGVVSIAVWLVVSTRVFLRNQRALFAWLHARNEMLRRRQWAVECSVQVAEEVHRLGVLYRQSRLWARVLGAVVHDPFGVTVSAAEQDPYPAGLSGALPLSTAVGVAAFDPDRNSQLIHEARCAQLGIGWLGRQLQQRIEQALAARSKQYGRAEHRAVWSDTGYSAQGPLWALVSALGTVEDRRQAAGRADDALVQWLASLGSQQGLEWSLREVHPEVLVTAGAVSGTVTGEEFLSPVLRRVTHLDAIGFSDAGAASLSNEVDHSSMAAVGVPVPTGIATPLRARPGDDRTSMDRFVARLDTTRQLALGEVAHFTAMNGIPEPYHPSEQKKPDVPPQIIVKA